MSPAFEHVYRQWGVFHTALALRRETVVSHSRELVIEAQDLRDHATRLREQLQLLRYELQEYRTITAARGISYPPLLRASMPVEPERTFREAIALGLANFLRSIRLASSARSLHRIPNA
jgi:hypothetical protein